MAVLLFIVGALVFVAGAVTIGFGVVIELSFGNALITAGTMAAVGGLILIGLGAAISQLQRIADGLMATRLPTRPARVSELFEAPPRAAGRVPFPSKPRSDAPLGESGIDEPPMPAEAVAAMPPEEHFAAPPWLRNPEAPPAVEEDVSLTPPPHPSTPAPTPSVAAPEVPRPSARRDAALDKDWRMPPALEPEPPPPSSASFENLWPPRTRPAPDSKSEPKVTEPPRGLSPAAPAKVATEPPSRPDTEEPRAVAILKSGVVDGMGYTLYVDGSIEAELPQGTLRFASINDLRGYLEKNA